MLLKRPTIITLKAPMGFNKKPKVVSLSKLIGYICSILLGLQSHFIFSGVSRIAFAYVLFCRVFASAT